MKEIIWEGDSRDILRSFPESVRRDLGTSLMYLQMEALPLDAKPFKTGMPGTWELRAKDSTGAYRAIYVSMIRDKIHVLHCFKKTSNQTSRPDVNTAQLRYKNLKQRIQNEKK